MNAGRRHDPQGASFLPDDYLRRKAERRSGIITLVLFAVVMFGVIAAFLVTNRQRDTVRALQQSINQEYAQEARKIDQLKVLESQKAEMLEKADITTALIEKVPRSILLAEIINRMPRDLTLTDLKLTGKRVRESPPPQATTKQAPRSLAGVTAGPKPGGKHDPAVEKPRPPRFEFTVSLSGISRSDTDVADYHAALLRCPFLDKVDLAYTGETMIKDAALRKFRIEAMIRTTADARQIEPLQVPRFAGRARHGASGGFSVQDGLENAGFVGPRERPGRAGEHVTGVPDGKE